MSESQPLARKKSSRTKKQSSHVHGHDHDHSEAEQKLTFMDKFKSCFKPANISQKYSGDKDTEKLPQLTKSQKRARARDNWSKLRSHVRNMRFKINFLAFSNDEAEMTKKIMGYDAD